MATYKYLRGFKVLEQDYWWYLALEQVARKEGLVKSTIDLYQTVGGSPLSGGTHTKGGAIDCYQSSNPNRLVWLSRYGGAAAWYRHPGQGFSRHIHAGLKGIPNMPYAYQVAALDRGYNGLGRGGYGGRDDGPRSGLFPLVSWETGLKRLRELGEGAPEVKVVQANQGLRDFHNGWLAVDRWDAQNPEDATLTGLSDSDLRNHLVKHEYTFYNTGSLHSDLRYSLADFVTGQCLPGDNPDYNAMGWNTLLKVLADPEPGITWIELRPIFDAAHAGGKYGFWGEKRTRHSVRAIQSGLNHFNRNDKVVEDGIYGLDTRKAVSTWQVGYRNAKPNSAASDGAVGIHDALHLVKGCSERVGREHRLRFLY